MAPNRLRALVLFCLIAPISAAFADDRIDELLAEVKALRQQVQQLESRIDALEGNASAPAASSVQSASPSAVAPAPEDHKERRKWFENMRLELKKAEALASGPWTDPAAWNGIAEGMEKDEVVARLGEPTRFKFSVRKDTDEILIYEGDLLGDGELIRGEIRIYKGKVRRFESPDFPTE